MPEEPITIVLVDDDESIRLMLRVNFELDPRFELVGWCGDGAEALEVVQRHRPDAVLMDLNMPVVDGITATRLLLDADPEACVIAFTASDDRDQVEAVQRAGAVAVLRKPFEPAAFLDAVARHAATCQAA